MNMIHNKWLIEVDESHNIWNHKAKLTKIVEL